ncbi:MAG: biotin/lipoyl-binding protein, partial [Shewanella sp.]
MRQTIKLASVISVALWMAACSPQEDKAAQAGAGPQSMEVGVINVAAKPQVIQIELPGRSKAFLEAEVRPQVSGIITKRSFVEGGHVKQGESLYQIDSAPYKAALVSANADLARANASLASAKAKAARYQQLVKTNALSKQD